MIEMSGPEVWPKLRSDERHTYTRDREPEGTESAKRASRGAEWRPMKRPHNADEPHRK